MSDGASKLLGLSMTELIAAFRRRALSPVEATRVCLERIERLDAGLHAYVEVFADAALALARASEHRWRSGMPAGLLDGVPLALKDLMHIAGFRTSAGSTLYAGRPPATTTSTVVARLMAAGGIPLGKTHLVELAYGGWGTNRGMGTPRNPWDAGTHRAPGGSSSGSAVAVAAGLAAAAIGTDTGGSVRIPAAFCGLTGLRPTLGRVSRSGFELVSHTLDTAGPMTWTAEDAALVLQAMHGPDPLDAATLQVPPEDFVSDLRRPVTSVRISLADPATLGRVDGAVWRGVTQACEVLQSLGCIRRDDAFSAVDFVADQEETGIIISCEAFAHHGAALREGSAAGDAASRARVMRGAAIPSHRYAAALANRLARQREFAHIFDHTDVLVLPTVPLTATTIDEIDEDDSSPSRLTRFVGYYGLCAIALPCGLSPGGLPVSVQLVAAAHKESLLLRLGVAFQEATTHHRRRPAIA